MPETILHPDLLKIAEIFLGIYPDMAFEELILRCMVCSPNELCPHDLAAFERVYINQWHLVSIPCTQSEVA